LDDHVTGADAGLGGTAALDDVSHQHARFRLEPELAGHRRRERLHREPELALAVRLGRLGGRLVLEPRDMRVELELATFRTTVIGTSLPTGISATRPGRS